TILWNANTAGPVHYLLKNHFIIQRLVLRPVNGKTPLLHRQRPFRSPPVVIEQIHRLEPPSLDTDCCLDRLQKDRRLAIVDYPVVRREICKSRVALPSHPSQQCPLAVRKDFVLAQGGQEEGGETAGRLDRDLAQRDLLALGEAHHRLGPR